MKVEPLDHFPTASFRNLGALARVVGIGPPVDKEEEEHVLTLEFKVRIPLSRAKGVRLGQLVELIEVAGRSFEEGGN